MNDDGYEIREVRSEGSPGGVIFEVWHRGERLSFAYSRAGAEKHIADYREGY